MCPDNNNKNCLIKWIVVLGSIAAICTALYILYRKYGEKLLRKCRAKDFDFDDDFCDDCGYCCDDCDCFDDDCDICLEDEEDSGDVVVDDPEDGNDK